MKLEEALEQSSSYFPTALLSSKWFTWEIHRWRSNGKIVSLLEGKRFLAPRCWKIEAEDLQGLLREIENTFGGAVLSHVKEMFQSDQWECCK